MLHLVVVVSLQRLVIESSPSLPKFWSRPLASLRTNVSSAEKLPHKERSFLAASSPRIRNFFHLFFLRSVLWSLCAVALRRSFPSPASSLLSVSSESAEATPLTFFCFYRVSAIPLCSSFLTRISADCCRLLCPSRLVFDAV